MDSFERQWQRWFPEDGDNPPPGRSGTSGRKNRSTGLIVAAVAVIGVLILINVLKGVYTDYLWFDNLGYSSVFTTIIGTRVLVFFIAAAAFIVLLLGNMVLATRLAPRTRPGFWPWAIVSRISSMLRVNVIIGTLFLAFIFGMVAQGNWETILRFFNGQPFGVADPIFQREVAFYVFSLPFLKMIQGWLTGALVFALLGSGAVYLLSYAVQRLKFDFSRRVLAHIGGLLALILALIGWGYWLGIWELVYSGEGAVLGAGYTDLHASLPAQWILVVTVVLFIGVIIFSVIRRSYRPVLYAFGIWIAVGIIAGGIYPAIVQRFQVEPNEFTREKEYIGYNIEYTRQAFALDRIEEVQFPAKDAPTPQDIADNPATIRNIRLWDPRPLISTYNQLQSFRQYYDFNDVDIDRYTIDGDYSQVMLSARELSADKLPSEAQTWVNRKLQFTHGYGFTLSLVNEIGPDGLPVLRVKDIPLSGVISLDRPQVYYGEQTDDYVIVKTQTEELDYATGANTVYGFYEGNGGVSLNGFIRRLAYAWQFGDFNILISSQLTPDSRILYNRNIQQRVNRLAPFLRLDRDPYLVAIDGRLFWIQDAYTVTDRYPYSEADGGINYIRNSVKAVIDAYTGDVTFYIADSSDALIQTYRKIFPDLFVAMEDMPESVKDHLRYPEDMFTIQSRVYQTYHMRDPRVFYNKEDLWTVPKEVYFGVQQQPVQPYYVIMKLPGEDNEEFLLMLPFTPSNKDIAIGWLAARSDGENYGKLLSYLFPKGETILGPSQIENRIGQDTVVTEQLALWGRGGSNVIRGNLLLIPIGESMLFVEPVFLEAQSGGLPELKRVIVATGEKLAMEPTLAQSLAVIFGEAAPTPPTEETGPPAPPETVPGEAVPQDVAGLIAQAQQHYDKALEYQRAGNWSGYGEELAALEDILKQLAQLAGE